MENHRSQKISQKILEQDSLEKTIKLQEIASNPQNSAFIFASAGSGKTKILVDRVLRLLLEGTNPNKILCITYTKAAAREMTERVNHHLKNWLLLEDEKLDEKIAKITQKPSNEKSRKSARSLYLQILDGDFEIKIQTIHAFCQNLAKIFPIEMNLSPNSQILDPQNEKILLKKARNQLLQEAHKNHELRTQINEISAKLSDSNFLEILAKILQKKEELIDLKKKFPNITDLISYIFTKFELDLDFDPKKAFWRFYEEINFVKIDDFLSQIDENDKGTDKKAKIFLQNIKNEANFDEFLQFFLTQKNEPRARLVTKKFEEFGDFLCEIQANFCEIFEKTITFETLIFNEKLLKITDRIIENYQNSKNEISAIDYNDLINKAFELLQNDKYKNWVKLRMDSFFDHILIDESQDTNFKQWQIINALTEDFFAQENQEKPRTIFIIGDEKQSIFSFQGAQSEISGKIFEYYQEKTADFGNEIKKIDLNNSFRCLPGILDFVDKIFKNHPNFAKISYKNHFSLRNSQEKAIVEVWPKENLEKQEKQEFQISNFEDEETCQKRVLAEKIAIKIEKIVKKEKRANFGDIKILLRTKTGAFDKIIAEELAKKQIPSIGANKIDFSKSLICNDILALMKFLLLKSDDLNLACLLKSKFFTISEDELFAACIHKNDKNVDLFDALAEKLPEIHEKLQKIDNLYQNSSLFLFFADLLNRENLVKNYNFNEKEIAILDEILLKIYNFCQENVPNLQKLVDFFENSEQILQIDDNSSNQVSINTIHSTKGLQAKIVFLPDCSFKFSSLKNSKESLIWTSFNDEILQQNQVPILQLSGKVPRTLKQMKQEKIEADKEELARLFYVALTRAENELYIAGFGDGDEDCWHSICEKLHKVSNEDYSSI